MRGYPQFSFWISITLVKIYLSCIITNRGKNTFESVGTVLNTATPPPKVVYCDTLAGHRTFNCLHGKTQLRLGGLPGLADQTTRLGGLFHLSRKRGEAEKIRVYMDRRVTPPPC